MNIDLDKIQSNAGVQLPFSDIGGFISLVLKEYVFYIAAILLLVYLVSGGLQLMLSRGDPKAVQMSQSKITNALIGFVIVFSAYWVVQILGSVFDIDQFTQIFNSRRSIR